MKEIQGQFMLTEFMQAIHENRLHRGWLMTPDETQRVVHGRAGRDATLSGWFVRSNAHPLMIDKMLRNHRDLELMARTLRSRRQQNHLILAQSIAGWEHRIILPLVGAQAKEFVASLVAGAPVQHAVSAGGAEDSLIVRIRFPAEQLNQLQQEKIGDVGDVEQFLTSLLGIIVAMLQLVGTYHDKVPEHVCVSYILPEGINFAELMPGAMKQGPIH